MISRLKNWVQSLILGKPQPTASEPTAPVYTPAGNPVAPPAPAPTELVIEQGAYRPTVSGPKDPPTLQQPAPVVEIKVVTEAKPEKPAKKSKEPKAPKTPKEPKAVKPKTDKTLSTDADKATKPKTIRKPKKS